MKTHSGCVKGTPDKVHFRNRKMVNVFGRQRRSSGLEINSGRCACFICGRARGNTFQLMTNQFQTFGPTLIHSLAWLNNNSSLFSGCKQNAPVNTEGAPMMMSTPYFLPSTWEYYILTFHLRGEDLRATR